MKDGSFSKVVPTFESTTVWLPAVRLSGLHVLVGVQTSKTLPQNEAIAVPRGTFILGDQIDSSKCFTTYHNLSSLGRKNKDPPTITVSLWLMAPKVHKCKILNYTDYTRSRLFYSTCEWFRNGMLFKTTELMSTLRLSVFLICIHHHLGMSMGHAHWKLNTLCNGLQYSYIYIYKYTLWLFNIAMERSTIFKFGKPFISIGHLYHGYVSHNQMVYIYMGKL